MIPPDFASYLCRCALVVDNARSHTRSATESAEQLPPLCSFTRAAKAARKSKNRGAQPNRAHGGDRWTAEVITVQPLYSGLIGASTTCRASPTSNTVPLISSNDQNISPRLVAPRRIPSSDGMDCMSMEKMAAASPKRPSRKLSTLDLVMGFSPRIIDLSPRKPERRTLTSESNKVTTAQLLRDALSICDLSQLDNDSSDDSTVESLSTVSNTEDAQPAALRC